MSKLVWKTGTPNSNAKLATNWASAVEAAPRKLKLQWAKAKVKPHCEHKWASTTESTPPLQASKNGLVVSSLNWVFRWFLKAVITRTNYWV